MGLFDFIRQLRSRDVLPDPVEDPPPPPAEEEEPQTPPELYSGMRVEVTTPENHLLFVGRLKIYGAGVLEVRCEPEGQAPQAMYKQAVKIRGFQRNSQAFSINGSVCRSSQDFWHIENLKFLQSKDHRDFFRQHTELKGTVIPNQRYRDQEQLPCDILDISASGIRLAVKKEFEKGSVFLLDLSVISEEAPFTFTCVVEWSQQRRRDFEYGCHFQDLSEKERERLLQAIFTLQRKTLQAKRDAL